MAARPRMPRPRARVRGPWRSPGRAWSCSCRDCVVIVVVVVVVMIVVVTWPAPGGLERGEADAGGDQQAPDDRVLGARRPRAELQPDGDEHRPQHDREQDVGHAGEAREARDLGHRVSPRPSQHGQRHPVVGQDGVAEADSGGRGKQSGRGCAHAVSASSGRAGGEAQPEMLGVGDRLLEQRCGRARRAARRSPGGRRARPPPGPDDAAPVAAARPRTAPSRRAGPARPPSRGPAARRLRMRTRLGVASACIVSATERAVSAVRIIRSGRRHVPCTHYCMNRHAYISVH